MESTLSLGLPDIEAAVADFLGYGRGPAFDEPEWTARQRTDIADCVRSGLRRFYFPAPTPAYPHGHDWSFLRPTASPTLPDGADHLDLPDDFGAVEGMVTVTSSGGGRHCPVDVAGEGLVRRRHAELPDTTGRPEVCAVRPRKDLTGSRGQRFELYVWPTADADYTLAFQYHLLPGALETGRPYAYGGAAHAETILESCLAVAEERRDDTRGVHAMKFQELMLASLSQDRRTRPQVLGVNRDRSEAWGAWRGRPGGFNTVTFDGVEYD